MWTTAFEQTPSDTHSIGHPYHRVYSHSMSDSIAVFHGRFGPITFFQLLLYNIDIAIMQGVCHSDCTRIKCSQAPPDLALQTTSKTRRVGRVIRLPLNPLLEPRLVGYISGAGPFRNWVGEQNLKHNVKIRSSLEELGKSELF